MSNRAFSHLIQSHAPVQTPANWKALPQSAVVTAVEDPENLGRVQIQLATMDPAGEALLWARVTTNFAGPDYGMFALPGVGEEVIVTFLHGDLAHPVIIGSVWNGSGQPPEDTPSGDVKVWSINGRGGTRIAIDESSDGSEVVSLETPAGAKVLCTGGDTIEVDLNGSEKITLSSGRIEIATSGTLSLKGSDLMVDVSSATVLAQSTIFSGEITCSKITTSSVISPSYTPGAGNCW